MSQDVNMKQIERRAYTSCFEDGLWDIAIGLFAAAWAVAPLLSDLGLSDIWSGVIFLPFFALGYVVLWGTPPQTSSCGRWQELNRAQPASSLTCGGSLRPAGPLGSRGEGK